MNTDYLARNKTLCRKEIDFIQPGNFVTSELEELKNISFFRVGGLTEFWAADEHAPPQTTMSALLSGICKYGVSFVYAIVGDSRGINIYLGVLSPIAESLKSSAIALYPGIDISPADNPLPAAPRDYGGFVVGWPSDKSKEDIESHEIEGICRGMLGSNFAYVVVATGISGILATMAQDRLHEELGNAYSMMTKTVSGGPQGNLSVRQQDFGIKNYYENLTALDREIKDGIAMGMWRVNTYYASDNAADAKRLSSIIKSSFSGNDVKSDILRCIEYNGIRDVIGNLCLMSELVADAELHPLGRWDVNGRAISMYVYKYQTLLTSSRLGILCNLPTEEFFGFFVDSYVSFDTQDRVSMKSEPITVGDIKIAANANSSVTTGSYNQPYTIEKNDLTRHALIVGITGGGKTNTAKSLLTTLWSKNAVPFLVIESAKREYWELRNIKGFEDLTIFTLGDESSRTAVPYRINPFEANPGVSLQTHIDYLLATFKAAFDLYPPAPYILEQAVYEVYSDRGWDTVENVNKYGFTEYPTLSDLYSKVEVIVDRLGYHAEVKSNVKAALQARIYSLMLGGKGAMLNTPNSMPIEKMLSTPTVLELEDLGDDETKSFVIGILLVQLYEYRKSQMTTGSKALSHILLIEEAHRLLKNVPEAGEGSSTRAKAVEFFCNMLAEIRTYGQGIIIADQIPTKLAPDTIKNTNLKIVHRTVAADDRETIGKAMHMTDAQIDYLSSLKRGFAAVYAEGDNRPKLVKMPLVESCYAQTRAEIVSDSRKKAETFLPMGKLRTSSHAGCHTGRHAGRHAGCAYCEERCRHYERISSYLDGRIDCDKVVAKWNAADYSANQVQAFLQASIMHELSIDGVFQRICVIGVILSKNKALGGGRCNQIIADFLKVYANSSSK